MNVALEILSLLGIKNLPEGADVSAVEEGELEYYIKHEVESEASIY
jgi:hypothetical protein